MHPKAILRHQSQLRLLLLHHGEVVEAGLYIKQAPQVGLPLFINDVRGILYRIITLPRVCVELDKIAAKAVVLALLTLLNQHYPARTFTVRHSSQHAHALHFFHFLAHPLSLLRGQRRGPLKDLGTRFDPGVKWVRLYQSHVTLPTS